jgi:gluconate 2-dehydrogenase gamma chain
MNRREMLERVALLMGGTVSASGISGILAAFEPPKEATYTPQTLAPTQDELVATIAELIIPTTDTPGARAAGVNRFIDGMLTSIYTEGERKRFLAGLANLEARAKARGSSFLASGVATQVQILSELETEPLTAGASGKAPESFFQVFRELTLIGYYRSEIGATQEQRYLLIPGYYKGDEAYKEIGRAWSSPWMRSVG